MVGTEVKAPSPSQNGTAMQQSLGTIGHSEKGSAKPLSPSEYSNDDRVSTISEKRTIIEPAVFLIYISTTIAGAVLQNQLLFQTCVAVYDYDKDVCEPLLGVKAKNDDAITTDHSYK
ncbi:uncharacterized protein LOC118743982 [Rhagoletis pomonella]|uniref:uncharacterized protein LOC118743982 n=1 Tax=Rhagoletis pomonella TaxID=28610 RepID=UPI0017809871|nr:uncharacterized protein LOC118743982 [Rhagoletis pomonella]